MYEYEYNGIVNDLYELYKKIHALNPRDMYEVMAINELFEAYSILVSKVYNLKRVSSFPRA